MGKRGSSHLGYRHSNLKARHPLLFDCVNLGFHNLIVSAQGQRDLGWSSKIFLEMCAGFESYYNLVYHQEKLVHRRRKH